MDHLFPPADQPLDPSWFAPLHLVSDDIRQKFRFFDPDDFMMMTRVLRSPRPSIVLYKHRLTRRYLNLDDGGQAYRWLPPTNRRAPSGRFVKDACLDDAVRRVGLWELPWMKPGLEGYRLVDWDIRMCVRRQIEFYEYTTVDAEDARTKRRLRDLDQMCEHLRTCYPVDRLDGSGPAASTAEEVRHGHLHVV